MPWTYDSSLIAAVAALIGFALGGVVVWRLALGSRSLRTQEATLRQDHEWFRVTLANINDAVIASNADGKVTFMNAAAESLTGWPQVEARGKPLTDVFKVVNQKTRQEVENPAARALREETAVVLSQASLLITREGDEKYIQHNLASVRDENGRVIGVVLIFRDAPESLQA
jgi:PAS domain S-box-containing protein